MFLQESSEFMFRNSFFVLASFFLFFSCGNNEVEKQNNTNKKITWSSHIAKIIYTNCTSCHRPGESGTFGLLTYEDALKNANKIKFTTQSRFMPPWPADPNYSHFVGERVLSEEEIELIKTWVDGGKQKGDEALAPKIPQFFQGSFFGKPDLTIKLKDPVFLKGNGADHFFMIKYPFEIPEEKFVSHVEFVPHKRKLVHHVNGHLISYNPQLKKLNHFGGEQIISDVQENFKFFYQKMNLLNDDNSFPVLTPNVVYYLPGYTPPVYPAGVGGFKLSKKGAFFLKNIHYGPTDKDTYDSSFINVFFAPAPPERMLKESQIGTFGLSDVEPKLIIPANEIKSFHSQITLKENISLLSVNPHMHLIGKSFLAYALLPSGDTIPLVKIKKWDFRWQYYYTFKKMLKLPAGTILFASGVFDNTVNNPFNPFSPTKEIRQGEGNESMQTTEEMFQFIYSYIPYKPGDENISLDRK